jgi:hypothetical protein
MGEWGGRLDPLEAVLIQRKLAQKGRANRQRVNRRANIVGETGCGQTRRTNSAADRGLRFQNGDRSAASCDGNRRGKTVRSGADDYRVVCVMTGQWVGSYRRSKQTPGKYRSLGRDLSMQVFRQTAGGTGKPQPAWYNMFDELF